MNAILVYVTCGDSKEAENIAQHLVEQKLIACANIMQPHKSVYEWNGKVETGEETAMILKTRSDLFDKVRAVICAMHSYDCPCIVALPVTAGHEPFLEWIGRQLAGS